MRAPPPAFAAAGGRECGILGVRLPPIVGVRLPPIVGVLWHARPGAPRVTVPACAGAPGRTGGRVSTRQAVAGDGWVTGPESELGAGWISRPGAQKSSSFCARVRVCARCALSVCARVRDARPDAPAPLPARPGPQNPVSTLQATLGLGLTLNDVSYTSLFKVPCSRTSTCARLQRTCARPLSAAMLRAPTQNDAARAWKCVVQSWYNRGSARRKARAPRSAWRLPRNRWQAIQRSRLPPGTRSCSACCTPGFRRCARAHVVRACVRACVRPRTRR